MSSISGREWWRSAHVYQIYPMSFCDGNGDGIGDVPGITSKLDHLRDLGVDVIWLSPIYASPNKDNGYDISDYEALDPRYGTMEDMEALLKGCKERGLKIVMDLVVNHTSSEHKWFLESRKSKTNPKRDWYIWRPAKYDTDGKRHPPNNWSAAWGGSAWEWDEETQEYWLHFFLPEQPDLNWDNPVVREAVFDLMHFWLRKGVSGFRMDVINLISKPEGLPDAPSNKPGELVWGINSVNGPHVHEYLQEMNARVLSHYDTITVGETPWTHEPAELAPYVLPSSRELNMVFTFDHMDIDAANLEPLYPREWKLSELKSILNKWQTHMHSLGGWNSIYIENHDQARSVSRFGSEDEKYRALSAKMLATLAIAQSGTIYVFQGQEIGMKNVPSDWSVDEYKDVASQHHWKHLLELRKRDNPNPDMSDVMAALRLKARDNARTPVQWSGEVNGGFSTAAKPWMRANPDFKQWNIEKQKDDPESVLSFWKQVLRTRKQHDVLILGSFRIIAPEDEKIFAVARQFEDKTALILLNFSRDMVSFQVPADDPIHPDLSTLELVLANYSDATAAQTNFNLKPFESRVYVTKEGM
ncbi:glycoside hydrolase family 13 protein [Clavulina sp. PMI_390]|nr:glycoside hydrolase family 13 protein [Clavulina sp. PMI_390]